MCRILFQGIGGFIARARGRGSRGGLYSFGRGSRGGRGGMAAAGLQGHRPSVEGNHFSIVYFISLVSRQCHVDLLADLKNQPI